MFTRSGTTGTAVYVNKDICSNPNVVHPAAPGLCGARLCGAAGDGVRVLHEQKPLPVDLCRPSGRYDSLSSLNKMGDMRGKLLVFRLGHCRCFSLMCGASVILRGWIAEFYPSCFWGKVLMHLMQSL